MPHNGVVQVSRTPQERCDGNVGVAVELQLDMCGLTATADKAIDEPLVARVDQLREAGPRNTITAIHTRGASHAVRNVGSQINTTIAAPGVRVTRSHGSATAGDCDLRLRNDN